MDGILYLPTVLLSGQELPQALMQALPDGETLEILNGKLLTDREHGYLLF
jgi:hypothetical protein